MHTCPMFDWEAAWHAALYGPGGFFARGEKPSAHFRTSPLVGPELAEALLTLLSRVDAALGFPPVVDFVDVGAGGGELAFAVRSLASGSLASRLRVTAVEVGPPVELPGVRWTTSVPSCVGLLVGHEWLDAIPCPVVTGPSADPWITRWWPSLADGELAEVGSPRDVAWAAAVSSVRGAALAIDYGHLVSSRRFTLTGYRGGRQVEPVFDGSCDITAHVAFDACAAAAGGDRVLVSQRDALRALGLSGSVAGAGWDWLESAARAGRIAELRDPAGLGGFGWLLHGNGVAVADLLPALPPWRPNPASFPVW
ncbi:SAM-dependent MidA family methyltransferase [Lentzea flaviverrucosa]|uniref:SAM-dependent methyltransferase, MidA family n=2 Tax=Lentzea flaviverrucosa TaxID=200379 RepID=A0A1H9X409_9PSEU|nr:SAM-dependent MidA family methyltransferase [Lentzea flaviverrucosa]SES40875.1 SAM-dependent methyltransferase, MidA family [Lentzea flaviverrucosa]